jgi:hypothetical protein
MIDYFKMPMDGSRKKSLSKKERPTFNASESESLVLLAMHHSKRRKVGACPEVTVGGHVHKLSELNDAQLMLLEQKGVNNVTRAEFVQAGTIDDGSATD